MVCTYTHLHNDRAQKYHYGKKKTEKSNLQELASVTKVVEKRIAWVIHLQVSACLFVQALDACVRKWTRT